MESLINLGLLYIQEQLKSKAYNTGYNWIHYVRRGSILYEYILCGRMCFDTGLSHLYVDLKYPIPDLVLHCRYNNLYSFGKIFHFQPQEHCRIHALLG